MAMNKLRGWVSLLAGCLLLPALGVRAESPARLAWVEPMKKVHARFKGTPGTFAHFGDSITVSFAFWAPLVQEPKKMDAATARDYARVKHYLRPECWHRWKGPDYG